MKRLFLILTLALLLPTFAMAASDTMTAEESQFVGMDGRTFRVVTIAITWSTTPVALTNRTLRDI